MYLEDMIGPILIGAAILVVLILFLPLCRCGCISVRWQQG